jgi:enterochelin esterase family protein
VARCEPDATRRSTGVAGRRGWPRPWRARTIDPAAFDKNFAALDAEANSKIKMLWITCGTADSLIAVNRQFKDWLRSKNVQFTELKTPEVGHVWPYWRQNFTEFATKAFQK